MRKQKCLAIRFRKEHAPNTYTGECVFCREKCGPSHKERMRDEVAALPRETKQRVLDLLHEGKTIGETRNAVGLSLDLVCAIINDNIKSASWLSTEAA